MKKKLRVARIVSGMWLGGVEKKLASLLAKMNKDEFDLCVICLREKGPLADDLERAGIPVHLCPVPSRWNPIGIWKLRTLLVKEKIQVVHTHMYRANTSGTIAALLARVPVIISQVHNVDTWDYRSQIWTDRILSVFKDMTIFVSEAVRANFLESVPLRLGSHTVIYNGVDTEFYKPADDNPLKLEGEIRIGAVARLIPQKGIHYLIDVLSDTVFREKNIHAYILGDGPMRNDLEELARQKEISNRFHIMGANGDVVSFLRSIDIFVMPSLKEGFSNALLEAMAVGVPIIATAVGGNPEAIEDGESGILVPPGDHSAMRQSLMSLIDDPDRRKLLRWHARQQAQVFSQEKMIQKISSLYHTLAERKISV